MRRLKHATAAQQQLPDPGAIAGALGPVIQDYVRAAVTPLLARIEALEAGGARTLLESYRGAHRADQRYERGVLITHKGSLWFCLTDTSDVPGTSPHWQMCVRGSR